MKQFGNRGERLLLELLCYVIHWWRKFIFYSSEAVLNSVLWIGLLILTVVRLLSTHRVVALTGLGFSADLLSWVLRIRSAYDRRR